MEDRDREAGAKPEIGAERRRGRRQLVWGLLAVLLVALTVPATMLVCSVRKTHRLLVRYSKDGIPPCPPSRTPAQWVELLGGPEEARGKLILYMRLPERWAPHRGDAAFLLHCCGPEAVPALIAALDDQGLRPYAALGLGFMYGEAQAAVPRLLELADAPDSRVRGNVMGALGRIGGQPERTVPVLVNALNDREEYVRSCAYGSLQPLARKHDLAVKAFVGLMRAADPTLRANAAAFLARMGSKAKAAVPELIEALADDKLQVRENAAWVLGRIGPGAPSAVPALVTALKSEKELDRAAAAWALGKIGPAAKEAVPALRRLVEKDPAAEQGGPAACEALGRIGPAARPAAPAIEKLLAHKENAVRLTAALALWRVTGEAEKSLATAVPLLSRGSDFRKLDAYDLLWEMGPAAKPAVPEIAKMLSAEHYYFTVPAARTLSSIGRAASKAVPALEKAHAKLKGEKRFSVAVALWAVTGNARHPAVVELLQALDDQGDTCRAAADALLQTAPRCADRVPGLADAVKKADEVNPMLPIFGPLHPPWRPGFLGG